jgi:hypothetical protein
VKKLIAALVAFAAILVAAPWAAYVLTVVWGWFVVPLGAPAIGKAHAYGLMVVFGMFRNREPECEEESLTTSIGIALLAPALTLLIGYIAHRLMGAS